MGVGASVVAVLVDHLAYPETRHFPTLLGVGVAGGALAFAFLATGSILAPILGHALIHALVILRGGEVPPFDRAAMLPVRVG